MILSLLLVLATPSVAATPMETPTEDLVRVDVRGTQASITEILRAVEDLPPERRAKALVSLRFLVANDPTTRAALQLPFALRDAVFAVDPAGLEPLVQRDWETLKAGLTTHVAVLDALGIERELKGEPVQSAWRLVEGIPDASRAIDSDLAAAIEKHSAQVEAATGVVRPCPRGPWAVHPGQPWTLGMQLGGWHDALRRVQPFAETSGAKAEIGAMVALMQGWGEAVQGEQR